METVDMIQNQHQLNMANEHVSDSSDAPEGSKAQGTKLKVVSSQNKTSPQQVHKNDLGMCVGFAEHT